MVLVVYRLLMRITSKTRIITRMTAMPATAGIRYISAADWFVSVVAPGLVLADEDAALMYVWALVGSVICACKVWIDSVCACYFWCTCVAKSSVCVACG